MSNKKNKMKMGKTGKLHFIPKNEMTKSDTVVMTDKLPTMDKQPVETVAATNKSKRTDGKKPWSGWGIKFLNDGIVTFAQSGNLYDAAVKAGVEDEIFVEKNGAVAIADGAQIGWNAEQRAFTF